jgi:CheY-like chemotaxis protein
MENQKGTLSINLCRKEITEIPFHTYDVAPGSYIVLSVHDTGHGIDKRMMERIFDPYFTSKEAGKGTGLGLSVIDGIVKGYKGFITVESEPGNGASFHVHLPALEQDTSPQEIQEQEEKLENGKEHILVIDDEAIIANINKAILERLGYTATAMSDSAKALETIRSNPDQFDLLFTDQTMPNLTGAELSQEVLKINPHMPIILCTGYSSVFSQKEALEMGIRKYVTKPIGRKELAEVVRNVLDENSFPSIREKYPETAQVN